METRWKINVRFLPFVSSIIYIYIYIRRVENKIIKGKKNDLFQIEIKIRNKGKRKFFIETNRKKFRIKTKEKWKQRKVVWFCNRVKNDSYNASHSLNTFNSVICRIKAARFPWDFKMAAWLAARMNPTGRD